MGFTKHKQASKHTAHAHEAKLIYAYIYAYTRLYTLIYAYTRLYTRLYKLIYAYIR